MRRSHRSPVFRSPRSAHFFCGYYDKSPLDSPCKRHLAMRVQFMERLPNLHDEAVIGYFDLPNGKFVELTRTNAFNWQQGAMLQWIGPDFDREIIFNRRTERGFQAVTLDIDSGRERLLDQPIYVVSHNGEMALTIDYERHYWCRRGYSYDGVVRPEKNMPVVQGDGIWLLNIKQNSVTRLVEIESLLSNAPLASMKGATHYVEHMMFSPNGRSFAFYHRWKLEEGGIYARLYLASVDGGRPRLVHDTGRLSHYCWIDNSTILAGGAGKRSLASVLRKSKMLARALKPLLPVYRGLIKGNATAGQTLASSIITGDSYFLINTDTLETRSVFQGTIDRDGHPSSIPGRPAWIVTDTYPDANSRAHLLIGNLRTNDMFVIDELKSIPALDNSPSRCDLHPKVSGDGRFVSIDTMNDGVRGIYLYDLADSFPPGA